MDHPAKRGGLSYAVQVSGFCLLSLARRGEAYLTEVRDQRPFQGQEKAALFRGGC